MNLVLNPLVTHHILAADCHSGTLVPRPDQRRRVRALTDYVLGRRLVVTRFTIGETMEGSNLFV